MPRTSLASKTPKLDARMPIEGEPPQFLSASIDPSKNATILLVDDDHSVLESLGRVLEDEGWQVIPASNGEEALACLARQQPDLMITDLCMMEINGWDLLFHEKIQRPGLPIFVITALPPDSVGGADRFATEYFQKPLDIEAVITAIRRTLCRLPSMSA